MVSKEDIEKILNLVIGDGLDVKCGPTIAEMHEILSGMGVEEQFQELKEKGYLNPLELDDYESILDFKRLLEEQWDKFQANGGDDEFTLNNYNRQFQDIDDKLFYYGRRLIEGMKPPNEIPKIDTTSYEEDDQWGGRRGNNYEWSQEQGRLEKSQISAQQESINIDNMSITDEGQYVDKRLLAMNNYFGGDCMGINYGISHTGYLKALDSETQKQVKDIDSLMEDSPGLLQDTILYRGGHFDIHLREGDTFKFKGYTSATFQRETSDMYKKDDEPDMTYIIHAPKGTKGICGSDKRFYNNNWEHEYVLPRNTNFVVLSIDYDTMTVELGIQE